MQLHFPPLSRRGAAHCRHLSSWALIAGLLLLSSFALAQTQAAQAPQSPAKLAVPNSAGATPGSVSGTVLDRDGAVVPNAQIILTGNNSSPRKTTSASDGSFNFTDVAPGAFQLSVTAAGFATRNQSSTLAPGENEVLPPLELVVATSVQVNVTVNTEEIAAEQMHVEEQQHLFGVIPNFYVTYLPDAAPFTSKQKFELAWKQTINPISFAIPAVVAGFEQASNSFSGYGQGLQGYGKRYGATLADGTIGTFVGSAIFPSLLKQDPRYFYKGTGDRKSRVAYAIYHVFRAKGDNGHWQPNYSTILGGLAAGGISNLYYPASDRGARLTFENTLIGLGGDALANIFEEFFSRKLTPHPPDPSPGQY